MTLRLGLLAFVASLVLWSQTAAAGRKVTVKAPFRTSKWTTPTTSFVHRTQTGPGSIRGWTRFSTRLARGGPVHYTGGTGAEVTFRGTIEKEGGVTHAVHETLEAGQVVETSDRKTWNAGGTTFGVFKTIKDGVVTTERVGFKKGTGARAPTFLRQH